MNSRDVVLRLYPDLTQAPHVSQIYFGKFTECYLESAQWYAVVLLFLQQTYAISASGERRGSTILSILPLLVSRSNALMKSETNFTLVRPVIIDMVTRNLSYVDFHYVPPTHDRPHAEFVAGFKMKFDRCLMTGQWYSLYASVVFLSPCFEIYRR